MIKRQGKEPRLLFHHIATPLIFDFLTVVEVAECRRLCRRCRRFIADQLVSHHVDLAKFRRKVKRKVMHHGSQHILRMGRRASVLDNPSSDLSRWLLRSTRVAHSLRLPSTLTAETIYSLIESASDCLCHLDVNCVTFKTGVSELVSPSAPEPMDLMECPVMPALQTLVWRPQGLNKRSVTSIAPLRFRPSCLPNLKSVTMSLGAWYQVIQEAEDEWCAFGDQAETGAINVYMRLDRRNLKATWVSDLLKTLGSPIIKVARPTSFGELKAMVEFSMVGWKVEVDKTDKRERDKGCLNAPEEKQNKRYVMRNDRLEKAIGQVIAKPGFIQQFLE
eukprot:Blabericola_migrator_1__8118@NODE_4187_length_1289_cov_22_710311_g2593_i0_p1_GENE_NODE_4187_length_1289_cov_22_710311_g2593_i0NODE_4187_length_1289_cov_22_710311_g2593_i0_p1_ORF_typecomplete_len333_score60_92Fbox/PF00646_33/0_0035_NODE_4187_length_1289_cov_22_710311_g2593_i01541152